VRANPFVNAACSRSYSSRVNCSFVKALLHDSPSFQEFQRLANKETHPCLRCVFRRFAYSVSAYLRIAQGARFSFLLESVEGGEKIARYTFAALIRRNLPYANGACVLEAAIVSSGGKGSVTFLRAHMERFRPFDCQVCRRSLQAPSVISVMTWFANRASAQAPSR